MVILAVLAFLSVAPQAQADCLIECTAITAKITLCTSVRNGFTDQIPTIGVDYKLDDCMCNQENVRLIRKCYACKDLNTAMNVTNKFISDCKVQNTSRNLVNGASSSGVPAGVTYVAILIASIAMASLLGH
ncbi:hypothetical protein BGW38_010368 [Lunasporangiospora selenospora]|uniref:Uncharacterized protein n=1 Tax=Lunasporangiospora selenospora TaxID=979761 RepID=A0A9P6JXB6_9FUNG|nr:hypothetical protein BGW38_010368 [Lunasporangiospora selenospora]